MSLVDPWRHALAYDDEYKRRIAGHAVQQKMKPGIAGWAK